MAPLPVLLLAGCSSAPSQNILGSYFPSWMICALVGIAAAVMTRQVFVVLGIEEALPAPLAIHLLLATAFAFAAWLIWFG